MALAVSSLVMAGCGDDVSASGCRAAAVAQAEAENVYFVVLSAHEEAHAAGDDSHPGTEDPLAARVDLIVATEATARACR